MTELQSTEQWRPVPGFEGYYSVSNMGRVRREKGGLGATPGKLLIPFVNRGGYHAVTLHNRGRKMRISVHRLVLMAFAGPCPSGMECRHLNGTPDDNRSINLAWGTSKENGQDMIVHGRSLKGERNPLAKLTEDDVLRIRCMYQSGATQAILGSMFGVSPKTINNVTSGVRWRYCCMEPILHGNRAPQGESHYKACLTAKDVKHIRLLYAAKKANQVELAARFNVTQGNISAIIRRSTWAHVE